jgi:hypothetical protein
VVDRAGVAGTLLVVAAVQLLAVALGAALGARATADPAAPSRHAQ